MDRRRFCKMAALAAGALGLTGLEGRAAVAVAGGEGRMGARCRLTVLRRECFTDLQSLFMDDPETGPCGSFHGGEEWTVEAGDGCPEGFCPRAWETLRQTVASAAHCPSALGRDRLMVAACPDGTRPVIFKIELL